MAEPTPVDEAALRADPRWNRTKWEVRLQFIGIFIVVLGLQLSKSPARWPIVIAGIVVLLAFSIAALMDLRAVHRSIPDPRPTFLAVRSVLIRDSIGFGRKRS